MELKPNEPVLRNVEDILRMEMPLSVSNRGGTRADLFRTPISGGVQSTTSAHGLHRPALAVRNLMEQPKFSHLCSIMSTMHHRWGGYPFGTLVDFAPDPTGTWLECLSNARVTIFGDVYPLPESEQNRLTNSIYQNIIEVLPSNGAISTILGCRTSGFGTVAWVDVKEYESILPDKIAVDGGEQNLKELNAISSKPLKELLSMDAELDAAALISTARELIHGSDKGAQFNIQKISFEEGNDLEMLEEAKAALYELINRRRVPITQ